MLRQLMPVTIAFINAQFAAGADIVVLADHATRNLVGPHHYEQYLLPIHQEITAQVGGPDHPARLRQLLRPPGALRPHRGRRVSLRVGRSIPGKRSSGVGDRISLVGNINNARTLLQGTPEDVYQQARYAIEAGVNIIGPECAIPLSTPLENLRAIVEAAREGY